MKYILQNLLTTRIKLFIARILFCLVRPVFGTGKRIVTRSGLNFEVDITEGLDLSLFLFGSFQKHVSENKFLNLSIDAVVLDVGANVGVMSLQFAHKARVGKMYAFEPTHYAFKKLKRNIELNPGLQNIKTVQTFISCDSNRPDEIQAFSSWKINAAPGSNRHPVHGGKPMPTDGVPCTTIDDFVREKNLDRIDLIKIDTDGHDFDVLLGARKSIVQLNPTIIFELGLYLMEENGISFEYYEQFFSALNYRLSNAATNEEITILNHNNMIPKRGTVDILAVPLN